MLVVHSIPAGNFFTWIVASSFFLSIFCGGQIRLKLVSWVLLPGQLWFVAVVLVQYAPVVPSNHSELIADGLFVLAHFGCIAFSSLIVQRFLCH